MKLNVSLVVCTASLFVVFPLMAQKSAPPVLHENNGHHNPHGDDSDHGGHDEDGGGKGHKNDKDDKGRASLVLKSPGGKASVVAATTSVTTALNAGTLRTTSGALIPVSAQARTHAVLTADRAVPTAPAEMSAALSTAGPEASAIVPSLVGSISGLASNPEKLPTAITEFNRFTRAASGAFIKNPPPEFTALHTVLARLTAAAGSAK